ncbi:hypothetical protein HK096_009459 [Nowakowskiella sp. JEL0078]|nr:hypothetical protein HK096_009459 [Nowakowskiella sp. JEL0078]
MTEPDVNTILINFPVTLLEKNSENQPHEDSPEVPVKTVKLTTFLSILFAVSSAFTAANLYWSQPILQQMSVDFKVSESEIGILSTATGLGYATGILFITPLGDMLSRRNYFVGVVTVIPQVLIPLVADLAEEENRGKAIGTLLSGLMFGILGARIISGMVAFYSQWRTVYILASCLMVVVSISMFAFLPELPSKPQLTYPKLMISLWTILREQVVLRQTSAIVFMIFAVFNIFWTDLTFHLSADPFNYNSSIEYINSFEIGLFGLIGIAGVSAAPVAGRFGDKYGPYIVIVFGLLIFIFSCVILLAFGGSLVAMIVGSFLLDFALQFVTIANQIRVCFGFEIFG